LIDILLAGTVFDGPHERLADDGDTRVKVTIGAVDGRGEQAYVICTAKSQSAKRALMRLKCGDSLAVAGHAAINKHPGDSGKVSTLRVIVTRVLTVRDEDFDELD